MGPVAPGSWMPAQGTASIAVMGRADECVCVRSVVQAPLDLCSGRENSKPYPKQLWFGNTKPQPVALAGRNGATTLNFCHTEQAVSSLDSRSRPRLGGLARDLTGHHPPAGQVAGGGVPLKRQKLKYTGACTSVLPSLGWHAR
jgi:hypothetical protein